VSPAHEQPEQHGPHGAAAQDDASSDEQRAAARRRRRAQVFGEVLPDSTSDERGDGWGDREPDTDEWLRRQVPPHHG
jgi:hypothetical protein